MKIKLEFQFKGEPINVIEVTKESDSAKLAIEICQRCPSALEYRFRIMQKIESMKEMI